MAPARPAKLVYLALTCSAFFWGSGFAVARWALRSVSPWEFLAATNLFSALAQIAWTGARGNLQDLRLPGRFVWPVALLGLFGWNVMTGLTYLGLRFTTATNAALLYGFSPVMIALLAALFLKEPFGMRMACGAAAGFAGVALIITQAHVEKLSFRGVMLGNLVVFVATVYWAAYSVGTRALTQRLPAHVYSFYVVTLSVFLPLGWVWIREGQFPLLRFDPSALLAGAFMGVGTGMLAINLWNWGLARIEASRVGVFSYLEPVFASAIAMGFLGERLIWPTMFGAGLVFLAIYLSTTRRAQNPSC